MGLLLFAARKLMLKSKINNLNYRNMLLSQEQQSITKQIAQAQQTKNAAKNLINTQASQFVLSSVLSGLQGDSTVKEVLKQKGLATCSANDLQTLLNGGKLDVQGKEISLSGDDFSAMSSAYQTYQYQAQMKAAATANYMNQILDNSDSVQLAQLNAKDSQISLELENNETQLNALQAEYKNVKEAERAEAQNSAPTYVA